MEVSNEEAALIAALRDGAYVDVWFFNNPDARHAEARLLPFTLLGEQIRIAQTNDGTLYAAVGENGRGKIRATAFMDA